MKKIFLLIIIIALASCRQSKNKNSDKSVSPLKDSIHILTKNDKNSEAPFLFNNGNTILINWTERDEHNKKQNLLKFAVFDSKNLQFDSIFTVPASKGLQMHAESMAKVGIKKDGTIIAVYRKKSVNDRSRFGGHLYYVSSNDAGKTWRTETKLVKDSTSTSQSFYDIADLPNRELGLIWLDSRSKRRGKTLYYAETNNTNKFNKQTPVAFSTCECCRTEIYVDNRGIIHLAYRNLIEPDEDGFDGYGKTEIRDMYYLQSKDTGRHFTKPLPISRDNWHIYGCPHTGPSLAYNGKQLGAIWFTGAHQQSGLFFTTQTDSLDFLPRKPISVEGRHPQMIEQNGKFYAVYEEYYEDNNKGYYKIILDVIQENGTHQAYEISNPKTNNNHAVLTRIDDHLILIAWVNTDTRHPKIMYKIVDTSKLQ